MVQIFLAMQQRTNHFSTFARPTEVTYAHLMKASVGVGKYERALELWEQLLSTGLTPGSRSSRAALSACWLAGDVEAALKVGLGAVGVLAVVREMKAFRLSCSLASPHPCRAPLLGLGASRVRRWSRERLRARSLSSEGVRGTIDARCSRYRLSTQYIVGSLPMPCCARARL